MISAGRVLGSAALRWTVLGAGLAVAVAVPVATLPRLPHFTPWPVLLALLPWTVGKYVLCPLRWHAISTSGRERRWHLAAYAESELLGLLTPGHVGADGWRARRLARQGMPWPAAAAEVGLDRLVGALAMIGFVGFAATSWPARVPVPAEAAAAAAAVLAAAAGGALLAGFAVVRRVRPQWIPHRPLPPARVLIHGLLLSVAYQASIVILLVGAVAATGNQVTPLAALGAFGASQVAGVIPGPNGASPRDGALVVALAALGVPWAAALGAVTLKAVLAWAPAVALGGGCLLLARRRRGRAPADAATTADGA